MLGACGEMVERIGGPSVRPPQPDSVTALAYGGAKWNADQNEKRFRRSLYTFSKRTAPFAAFTTFDAPSGENCTAARARSNTPLQALTLLNDQMYVELARALAARSNRHTKDSTHKINWMFRSLLTRRPTEAELSRLVDFYQRQIQRLADAELSATEIMGSETADNESAALTMVARILMNLDEVITKQ